MLNKLMDLLGPKPVTKDPAPRPKTSGARDYQLYKAEAESMGDPVMTPDEWIKKR